MLITSIGLDLSTLFAIKINTPCHVLIIDEFLAITSNIINNEISPEKIIIMIICYTIIFFFSLVFNEIIEINCFGLLDNTRRNIMKREKTEDSKMFRGPSVDNNYNGSMAILEMNVIDSLVDNEVYK